MATEEYVPPTCAFALSVLAERDQDPDAVPEEAIEAAQQHIANCARCSAAMAPITTGAPPRKKKRVRRATTGSPQQDSVSTVQTLPAEQSDPATSRYEPVVPQAVVQTTEPVRLPADLPPEPSLQISEGGLDCQQCRQFLPEYAEAMDSGQNVGLLYPEIQEHLVHCDSGCLILLDMLKKEAKTTRKYRRKVVGNPFGVIGWELSGFFRTGQVPIKPMALAYGTLILLLLVGGLSAYLGVTLTDAHYHQISQVHTIPTPDAVGLSDGLKIYDACNTGSYNDKRQAAGEMQKDASSAKAESLLASATTATLSDTTGCNGAEAAIYREDLHVRQSGRAYSSVVVSFDSGPGDANPQGGTNRHILYAAYTQELVGAYIAQQQYNAQQLKQSGAPLLYLILANTTGNEQGALQVANEVATLAKTSDFQQAGLLAKGSHPILAVLGLGPSSLTQVDMPVLCRAGIPVIAPTATGLFIIDLISQTSLYRHCGPGFAFVRFSADDNAQSGIGAAYAYKQLQIRNAAVFYDPSNPSSKDSAQTFMDQFTNMRNAHIVAQETAIASGLLDASGRPQASRDDLLAGLNDALHAKIRPQLIYAPLLTNDVTTLAQAIAKLPPNQQPTLLIGGEFVQPASLQGLVQWTRQQQLALPHIYIAQSSAARPPDSDWQKQFYANFCTSFATPGGFCSGATALDQGALLFGDGLKLVTQALGSATDIQKLPTPAQFLLNISNTQFAGVSGPIALRLTNTMITSTKTAPVILGIQADGSIQIVD